MPALNHNLQNLFNIAQKPEKLGTQGFPNKYFDYNKDVNAALTVDLYFDFSGK